MLKFILASVATAKTRLYIMSGQSNMWLLEPERQFIPLMEEAFPGDEVLVAHWAYPASEIRHWVADYPENDFDWSTTMGGDYTPGLYYDQLMQVVSETRGDKEIDFYGFAWMQGESDAELGLQNYYSDALTSLIG